MYDCIHPSWVAGSSTMNQSYAFWAPAPPATGGVNPETLAQRAVDSMSLHPPRLGATPLPRPGATSVVGLPTWLWLQDPDSHTYGPVTSAATAGPVTVTATARVTEVVWDLGDGQVVTCSGPGTPWTPADADQTSPDCGHRYKAAGTYKITATAHWRVDWTGAGQAGVIDFELSSDRKVHVTEVEVLVTG